MANSTSSARSIPRFNSGSDRAPSSLRPSKGSYTTPTALQDLQILDLLELSGSQQRAGTALAIHQSTVSRSLQLMQRQLRLVIGQGPVGCRYGLAGARGREPQWRGDRFAGGMSPPMAS